MSVDPELRSLDIEIPAQPEVLVKLSVLMAENARAAAYYLLPARAFELLLGAGVALYGARATALSRVQAQALAMAGLLLIAATALLLDATIKTMMETKGPVIVDMLVDQNENVYPMIPAGAAHHELVLGPEEPSRVLDKNQV